MAGDQLFKKLVIHFQIRTRYSVRGIEARHAPALSNP